MATITVKLADGKSCKVRRLTLFDLNDIGQPDPGDFMVTVHVAATGESYQEAYDLGAALRNPPPRPTENSDDWAVAEWQRFQAAIRHHESRLELARDYERKVQEYILRTCIRDEDRGRIVEPDDYLAIKRAAMCSEVKLEDLEQVLQQTFPGYVLREADLSRPG